MSHLVEHVLVVPTGLLTRIGHFQGFTDAVDAYLPALLAADAGSYRPRPEMEKDPSFKQLIPYVVFEHRDEQGQPWVFAYTRGSGQGEKRLHAKRSIGVGGHISSVDASAANVYEEGMRRELDEEVHVSAPHQMRIVGLINDDETEVGKVHLGVVHLCEIERPAISPREDTMHDAGFQPASRLLEELDRFETWSQIALKALYRGA